MRLGLIGAGRIAQSYVQALEKIADTKLVAVVDPVEECSQLLAERLHCGSYRTVEQMLDSCELDGAIVVTPPSTHGEICLKLLGQRIPVLCEKPVSLDLQTALAMVEAAQSKNVLFTMASKFRYVEDVIRAKSIISSGVLGEVVLFENTFTSRVDMNNRWNSQREISGGGVLIDNGTHSVDLMRYLMGPLDGIYVLEGGKTQGLPVEETVRVLVRSQSGVIGNIDLSWSLNKEIDHYLAVYGSHGTLRVGWKESTYKQADSREWVVFGGGYDKVEAFRRQIENFTGAIRGTERLLITAADAVASVAAIQAGYRSVEQGSWASLNEAGVRIAKAS